MLSIVFKTVSSCDCWIWTPIILSTLQRESLLASFHTWTHTCKGIRNQNRTESSVIPCVSKPLLYTAAELCCWKGWDHHSLQKVDACLSAVQSLVQIAQCPKTSETKAQNPPFFSALAKVRNQWNLLWAVSDLMQCWLVVWCKTH